MTTPTLSQPSADQRADDFVALLTEQVALFEQLGSHAGHQSDCIANGDTDGLLRVLSQRQQALTQLSSIDERIEPYRRAWSQFYGDLPAERRELVGGMLKQVQDLLGTILEDDDKDRRQLESEKSRIGSELNKVNTAGNAMRAYGRQPSVGDPRFADRRG